MPLAYNSARGEVPLRIGTVDLVIAAEMERLARLSTALGCQSFEELYKRLVEAEVAAVLNGVRLLAVQGDVGAASAALSIADFPACREAFAAALLHHVRTDKPGKAAAAGGETTAPQPSPGGIGRNPPTGGSDGAPATSGPQP